MKSRGLQNSNFSSRKKSARAAFKNFQSLGEFGKAWKCNTRPTLKNPNFESKDELEKVVSQFKFHC